MNTYLKPTLLDGEVYHTIYHKIRMNIPFCLTRFGDGEIYFLNDNVPQPLQEKVCNLWGYRWPDDMPMVKEEVCAILQTALDGSDIIGLLNPNHPICKTLKYDERKWSIPSDRIINPNVMICDHQITRNKLFGDIYNFRHILSGKSVNIVSPNTTQLQNNRIDELLGVPVTYTHIDNNREQMLDSIQLISDDVVLFGASLFGKDLGVILKSYGKVAIDFGATLDAWAGLCTRPWFKSGAEQEHCLISKS